MRVAPASMARRSSCVASERIEPSPGGPAPPGSAAPDPRCRQEDESTPTPRVSHPTGQPTAWPRGRRRHQLARSDGKVKPKTNPRSVIEFTEVSPAIRHGLLTRSALALLRMAGALGVWPRLGAGARTPVAGLEAGDPDLSADAEDRLAERESQLREDILSVLRPRPARRRPPSAERSLAEERLEQVGHVTERRLGRAAPLSVEVVLLTLLRIGQDLVGGRDLLEALLGGRFGVDVRMVLAREPPIGLGGCPRRRRRARRRGSRRGRGSLPCG